MAQDRREALATGLNELATAEGLQIVPDTGLVDEVAGLVEWPVPMLGRIDEQFMELPPEVMQVSMRVNQRYFALRDADGAAAPRFAFVANIIPADDGALIVAGNERVLRAPLCRCPAFLGSGSQAQPRLARCLLLDNVTFHAKLGSLGDRAPPHYASGRVAGRHDRCAG
jgi:glycyl-tRNA synthetase beta chain